MADKSKIEWTDASWNIITGCSVVSPGCTNCYAMRLSGTRLRNHPSREGLTQDSKKGPVWNGQVRFNEQWLDQPLRWKRPRRIFVCAHGDLFHESVPDEWLIRVFAVMETCREHIFQVLTKRPERAAEFIPRASQAVRTMCINGVSRGYRSGLIWPLPNVWIGTSVEDQKRADERIPHLLATPAVVRWVSYEPALGPLKLRPLRVRDYKYGEDRPASLYALDGKYQLPDCHFSEDHPRIDWVVCGGESGPNARSMHPDWARSVRDQCQGAGVAFFFKQWGAWAPVDGAAGVGKLGKTYRDCLTWSPDGRFKFLKTIRAAPEAGPTMCRVGKKAAGRVLDGREWNEYPHG